MGDLLDYYLDPPFFDQEQQGVQPVNMGMYRTYLLALLDKKDKQPRYLSLPSAIGPFQKDQRSPISMSFENNVLSVGKRLHSTLMNKSRAGFPG